MKIFAYVEPWAEADFGSMLSIANFYAKYKK
jgi:hypothetical protein